MRVLLATSEMVPLVKTGGLADVCGALPSALEALGVDARVVLPAYRGVLDRLSEVEPLGAIADGAAGEVGLVAGRTDTGVRVLAVVAPWAFDREGGPYLAPDRRDWPDNAARFAMLSRVAAAIGRDGIRGWRADVVHAHDWQTGLVPAYLRFGGGRRPACVMTIHNLAFQGVFPAEILPSLGLPAESFSVDGLEYYGNVSFLKAGLVYADHLTTVSPTYAREIQTPEQGMGLDGLLRHRGRELGGILNGIDDRAWDPMNDPYIDAPFSATSLDGKRRNRAALIERTGLDAAIDGPILCVISRLTYQKGLDLLPPLLPDLVARGIRLVVLGNGEVTLEASFRAAAATHPGRVAAIIGYDEPLSHLVQAGSDAIIIPSRFEPCGLTQLYGLRYGTLPIVARTGGLADTVIDANEAALADGVATGFVFAPVEGRALAAAIDRACQIYEQPTLWRTMQERAMTREFSWRVPAQRYLELYRRLVGRSSV